MEDETGYGKKSMGKWIGIYAVVGLIIYGGVYYFYMGKKGTTNYGTNSSASVAPVAKNSVEIKNFSFVPATLKIKAGETVTWTNRDSVGHSATADDKSFDTGILATGKSGTATFAKAGTYTYFCITHPNMKGTIEVE